MPKQPFLSIAVAVGHQASIFRCKSSGISPPMHRMSICSQTFRITNYLNFCFLTSSPITSHLLTFRRLSRPGWPSSISKIIIVIFELSHVISPPTNLRGKKMDDALFQRCSSIIFEKSSIYVDCIDGGKKSQFYDLFSALASWLGFFF